MRDMKDNETWYAPIILKPNNIKTPWAGTRLKKYRPSLENSIGIVREVCAYKSVSNTILSRQGCGKKLRDVLDHHALEILGEGMGKQIIRLAYIDAKENLSLQVHPSDDYAKAYEDDFEKAEAWYILDCSKDAYVVAGTTLTTIKDLQESIQSDTVMEHMIQIPVKPHDVVMVPSQLIHACGGDILALEISSFGGITYRLYDYGRGRNLDLDVGLKNINLNLRASIHNYPLRFHDETQRTNAINHPIFQVDIVDVHCETCIHKPKQYQILTSVFGDFKIYIDQMQYILHISESIIVPALINSYKIQGTGRLLISYQPLG